MTLKNKLKQIIKGKTNTLARGDVVKIANYIKNLEAEIRRLSQAKNLPVEITIVE